MTDRIKNEACSTGEAESKENGGNKEKNDRLIEELKRRLKWYQEEAAEEECDAQEIEAIVNLLDRLEKSPGNTYFTAQKAYERFERWYLPDTERPESEKDKNKSETAKRIKGRKGRTKKVLQYIGATAAAVLVLFTALNVGTYATAKKSFFELISQSTTGRSFFITGEKTEDMGSLGEDMGLVSSDEKQYFSWEELPVHLLEQICVPAYMPEEMELLHIAYWTENYTEVLQAVYRDKGKPENILELWIERYEDASTWQEAVCKEAEFLEQRTIGGRECFFYQYEEENMLCFWEENKLYTISGACTAEKLVKIVENMQYIEQKQ